MRRMGHGLRVVCQIPCSEVVVVAATHVTPHCVLREGATGCEMAAAGALFEA